MNWARRPRCDRTPAWAALQQHLASLAPAAALMGSPAANSGAVNARTELDLRQAFATEPQRFAHFAVQAPHVFADLSRQGWGLETRALLLQLAEQCGVAAHRDAMFAGLAINHTEGRAVGHVRLRSEPEHTQDMLAFADAVRANPAITQVVNIGIGGSDLGPQMASLALAPYADAHRRLHFVSNVDGHDLHAVLAQCRPENTLFLVASKTFTTTETMTNAASAKAWFLAQGGGNLPEGMAEHFVGLTTNAPAAQAFGVGRCFGFADWVGGRYSLWSAIGLSLAIAVGAKAFAQLLAGARAMDAHFAQAPLAGNLPVLLGLLDVWNRNFLGYSARCVAPYDQRLARLPAYLQQLAMESNGKSVDASGAALPFDTSALVWGEPGTNGQHAFFQLLHQGTAIIPVEFMAVREPHHPWVEHHQLLLANAVAQAQALMHGKTDAGGHKHFSGNRPSSFFLLERLDPQSLGALIALYEHRTFVTGSIWGINSFDQFGVELGKVLAQDLAPRLTTGDLAGLDSASAGLLTRLRSPQP
jgi:glucose-6-phosphate isomerase